MMKKIYIALLITLLIGCITTYKTIQLPYSGENASKIFPHIAVAAQAENRQIAHHDSSIHVKYDEGIWIQYMIQSGAFNMVIVINSRKVPEGQQEERFERAKEKGYELWEEALATRSLEK